MAVGGTFALLVGHDHTDDEYSNVDNDEHGVGYAQDCDGGAAAVVDLLEEFHEDVVDDGDEIDIEEEHFEVEELDDLVKHAVEAVA